MSDLILGVDPGGTTGVVIFDPTGLVVIAYEQLDLRGPGVEWAHWLDSVVPTIGVIAAERYFITTRTIKNSRQPDALDVLGALRYLAAMEGKELRLQSASDAKTAFPDDYLHEIGRHSQVKGSHARDALRHALLASRRIHKNV